MTHPIIITDYANLANLFSQQRNLGAQPARENSNENREPTTRQVTNNEISKKITSNFTTTVSLLAQLLEGSGSELSSTERNELRNNSQAIFNLCQHIANETLTDGEKLSVVRARATNSIPKLPFKNSETEAIERNTTIALISSTAIATLFSVFSARYLYNNPTSTLSKCLFGGTFLASVTIPVLSIAIGENETQKVIRTIAKAKNDIKNICTKVRNLVAENQNFCKSVAVLGASAFGAVLLYKGAQYLKAALTSEANTSTQVLATVVDTHATQAIAAATNAPVAQVLTAVAEAKPAQVLAAVVEAKPAQAVEAAKPKIVKALKKAITTPVVETQIASKVLPN